MSRLWTQASEKVGIQGKMALMPEANGTNDRNRTQSKISYNLMILTQSSDNGYV